MALPDFEKLENDGLLGLLVQSNGVVQSSYLRCKAGSDVLSVRCTCADLRLSPKRFATSVNSEQTTLKFQVV